MRSAFLWTMPRHERWTVLLEIAKGLHTLGTAFFTHQSLAQRDQRRIRWQAEVRQLFLRHRSAVSALEAVKWRYGCSPQYPPSLAVCLAFRSAIQFLLVSLRRAFDDKCGGTSFATAKIPGNKRAQILRGVDRLYIAPLRRGRLSHRIAA